MKRNAQIERGRTVSGTAATAQDAAGSVVALKTRIETVRFEASKTFYTTILGLQVLKAWDGEGDKGCILGFDREGSTGFLELGTASGEKATFPDALSLQLRTPDIEAFVRHLGDRWPFEGPQKRPWGSTYVYLKDPNGISIIVFEGEI